MEIAWEFARATGTWEARQRGRDRLDRDGKGIQMKKALILAISLLAASAANAATIQTFTATVTGTMLQFDPITGDPTVFTAPTTVTGTGTATLDSSGTLTLLTTTLTLGSALAAPLDETQTATNVLSGTLTGLVLDPYVTATSIDTCTDNNAGTFCSLAQLGYVVYNTGSAPITFDITPGGTTVFSDLLDLNLIYSLTNAVYLSSTTTLTAVPEPGTAEAVLAGLLGLAAVMRTRKRV